MLVMQAEMTMTLARFLPDSSSEWLAAAYIATLAIAATIVAFVFLLRRRLKKETKQALVAVAVGVVFLTLWLSMLTNQMEKWGKDGGFAWSPSTTPQWIRLAVALFVLPIWMLGSRANMNSPEQTTAERRATRWTIGLIVLGVGMFIASYSF